MRRSHLLHREPNDLILGSHFTSPRGRRRPAPGASMSCFRTTSCTGAIYHNGSATSEPSAVISCDEPGQRHGASRRWSYTAVVSPVSIRVSRTPDRWPPPGSRIKPRSSRPSTPRSGITPSGTGGFPCTSTSATSRSARPSSARRRMPQHVSEERSRRRPPLLHRG